MEKVFLGNLSADVDESSIRCLLDQNDVPHINIAMKRNFAFVTVKDKYTVDDLVRKLNGRLVFYFYVYLLALL